MSDHYTRFLITGGSGFIGRYLLAVLKSTYPEATVYVVGRSSLDIQLSKNFQYLYKDLSLPFDFHANVDVVFHLAGEKRIKEDMWQVNVQGTGSLLGWAADHGVKRFVYLSSVGVYGANNNDGVITEYSKKSPQNNYEVTKCAAEELVKLTCNKLGMEYAIIQPSNVIGWGHNKSFPLLGMMKVVKRGWFSFFGDGDYYFNYVSVEDVVDALFDALAPKAINGCYIINTPISAEKFVSWISDELCVTNRELRLPRAIGAFAAFFADLLKDLTKNSLPFGRERFCELTNTTRYVSTYTHDSQEATYSKRIESSIRALVNRYIKEGLL